MADVLIPSFLEVPFQTIVNRIDNGSRGLLQLTALLTEQKELQEKDILYALKVGRTNVFDHEIEASTTERLLGFYKNYYLYLYKSNMQHHNDFADQIINNLEQLKGKRGSRVIHIKQSIQQDIRNVGVAKDNLDKAKKVLQKSKADYLRAVEKLAVLEKTLAEFQRINEEKAKENTNRDSGNKFSMGRMFTSAFESNPEQDRDRQIRKLEKRKNEVASARQAIFTRKRELLDAYAALDENYLKSSLLFQDMELERMYSLKASLRTFCELEKTSLEHRLDLLKTLQEAVNLQQPEEDIALFISQMKQIEHTHKCSQALFLLEERLQDSVEDDEVKGVEEYVTNLETSDHNPKELNLAEAENEHENENDTISSSQRDTRVAEERAPDKKQQLENIVNVVFEASTTAVNNTSSADATLAVLQSESEDGKSAGAVKYINNFDNEGGHGINLPKEDDWKEIFLSKEARDRFLFELDKRRGKNASLGHNSYEMMSQAMKAFLDQCEDIGDVMSAMRISNMANTFHECIPNATTAPEENQADHNNKNPLFSAVLEPLDRSKSYLQSVPQLRDHTIWRQEGFWQAALRESVLAELHRSPPIYWHDLSADELREAVISVHNIVFGQLGSLSFVMQQQGLPNDEIVQHVTRLSRLCQLPEDQEFQLICSVTGQKVKEYVPPPAIAFATDQMMPAELQGMVVKVESVDGLAPSVTVCGTVISSTPSPIITREIDKPDIVETNLLSNSIITQHQNIDETNASIEAGSKATEEEQAQQVVDSSEGSSVGASQSLSSSYNYMQSLSSKFFSSAMKSSASSSSSNKSRPTVEKNVVVQKNNGSVESSKSTSRGISIPKDTDDDFAVL